MRRVVAPILVFGACATLALVALGCAGTTAGSSGVSSSFASTLSDSSTTADSEAPNSSSTSSSLAYGGTAVGLSSTTTVTTLDLLNSAKTRAEINYAVQLLLWSGEVPTIQSNLTSNPPDEEVVAFVIKQYDRATAALEDARPPESAAAAHALLLRKWLEGKVDLLEMQKAVEASPVGDYTPWLLSCLTATNEALSLARGITGSY